MPIPFLLIGLGAATAAVGVGKSIKAGVDQHDANEINDDAKHIIDDAKEEAEVSRKNSSDAITELGQRKIKVLNESMTPFVDVFEKIHNIELSETTGLIELQNFRIDKQAIVELKEMNAMASSIVSGAAGGAVLGAVTAFGAYGAAMTFGACATTGTLISTLSGAAATNATLAFLGGGALSVGGLGMAGGTAVLGGLVAGPALAVMGFVMGAKASANKNEAYSNLAKAKEFREEMKTVQSLCSGIRMRANMFKRILLQLDAIFVPLVYQLEKIVELSGTDYSKYSKEERGTVAACLSIAGSIKAVLDTPILTDEGTVTEESERFALSMQQFLMGYHEK